MATPGVSDLSNGTSSVMMTAPFLQRVWTDDFPAVALEEFVAFVVVCRAALRERLDIAADGDLVADLEGELAGEHPGDLGAVAVQMEEARGAGRQGFLEQHDALAGLAAEELQGKGAARRRRVEMLPAARGYDKAFGRDHVA